MDARVQVPLPAYFVLLFYTSRYAEQTDPKNIKPLPSSEISDLPVNVEYRIAYLAICLQDNEQGGRLFHDLSDLTQIDPDYIQFGSAEWFWRRCVNSFALQVEPERYKHKDKAIIPMKEALHVEKVRDLVFKELNRILQLHRNAIFGE